MSPTAETVCWAASLCVAVLIGAAWIRWLAKDRKVNASRDARKKALESCVTSWLSEISRSNLSGAEMFDKVFKTRVEEFNKLLIGMEKDFWPGQAEFGALTRRLSDFKASDFNGPRPAKEMLSERLQALVVFLNQN